MKEYKYCSNFDYPQYGIHLKVKSNKLDINNANKETIQRLENKLFNPVKFIIYNFCIPRSYDVDKQMFEIGGSLLLYKGTYKYYSELPHEGTTTYLSLETINQAMGGKFPEGTYR